MIKSKLGYIYNLKEDQHKTKHERFSTYLKDNSIDTLPQSVNLIPKFNSIEDQKDLGSCSAFSSGAIMEMLYGNPFSSSKLYIYYNGRAIENTENEDSGCTLEDQTDQLKVNGICNTNKWDYDTSKFTQKPSEICYQEGKNYLAGESYRVENFDQFKQALAMGLPIYFGVTVTEAFENAVYTGIIPDDVAKSNSLGGHALALVAYSLPSAKCFITKVINKLLNKKPDDTTYIFRNSWGTEANGKRIGLPEYPGYFQISETALKSILMDAWVLIKKQ